jgi:hypothetical protein
MCEDTLLAEFGFQDGDLWFVKFDCHVQTLTLATGAASLRNSVDMGSVYGLWLLDVWDDVACAQAPRKEKSLYGGSGV